MISHRKISRVKEPDPIQVTGDITKYVTSYEKACEVVGMYPLELFHFLYLPRRHRESAYAEHKLITICEALNQGWEPDYTNASEYKYFPRFNWVAGSGFVFHATYYVITDSYFGARLCYKSAALSNFAGKIFIKEYNEWLILKKQKK